MVSFNHPDHYYEHEHRRNQHQLYHTTRIGYIAFKTLCDSNMIINIDTDPWSRQIKRQPTIAYPLQILRDNDLFTVSNVNTGTVKLLTETDPN